MTYRSSQGARLLSPRKYPQIFRLTSGVFMRGVFRWRLPSGDWCALATANVARLCGVSLRAVQRWQAGGAIPPPCRRILYLYGAGQIVPEHWHADGWQFAAGRLQHPDGHTFGPGDLAAYGLNLQRLRAMTAPQAPQLALALPVPE
jgi:hypothetical protein